MAPYPDDHFKLGHYLGLIIYIGPAMMANIIKENGQVLHKAMYHALTGNRKSAKLTIVCSWSYLTRAWHSRYNKRPRGTECRRYTAV